MTTEEHYDIIMLGSGLPGAVLAGIIARMGARILIIEKGQHPRFAIGEAMLPQSTMWMMLLGERFNLPEINDITSVARVNEKVSKVCGQKRTISFLYHREGQRQDQRESHQVIAPEVLGSPDALGVARGDHEFELVVDVNHVLVHLAFGGELLDRFSGLRF